MGNPAPKTDHLTPWVKGQSGNPSGKPKQILTKDRVAALVGKFADYSAAQLQEVLDDPNGKVLEKAVAQHWLDSVTGKAPTMALQFLFDRSIGKPKDSLEVEKKDWSKEFSEAGDANMLELLGQIAKKEKK